VREDDRLAPRASPQPPDRRLSPSGFSRRSLLSPKALRLYDRLGLLAPAAVDRENGYRSYRESQLATARLIARLRRLDMPLAQVAEVVGAAEADRPRVLAAYWETVEQRVAEQRELVAYLQHRFSGRGGRSEMFEIEQREVPEQLVLTEQRHITVKDLQGWLEETIGRHWRTAEAFGGVSGPVFVLYHGEVNEDGDGPVEVCAPIDPARADAVDVPTRREPAHREAYTRIRKAQVAFPQILGAYDAVDAWIGANGKTMAGSPREVYFTDFMNAGPDDEVVDVAFPIE